MHGGFALVTGDPGAGKSAVLRLLAEHSPPSATSSSAR
jgi:ABC-type molybdenum transport system ATPase subunit/photorepair protein PhrA